MSLGSRLRRTWRAATGPRGRDVVVILIALSGLVLFAVDPMFAVNQTALPDWIAVPVGILGILCLLWRRRFPMVITGVAGLTTLIAGFPLPAMLALASLAIRRRDRGLVVATLYASLVMADPWSPTSNSFFDDLFGATVTATLCALGGAYIGARRDLLTTLRERAERAEAERELRGEQARTAERARIAREMHDVLAHKVSLIALQAGALEVKPDRPAAEIEESAALIRSTARATLEDLRGVLGVLRTDKDGTAPLAPQPGLADLERLVEDSRQAGVQVDLHLDVGDVPDTPHDSPLGRTVYRVVQESLTNVHKHARGARTSVEIVLSGPSLVITVTNVRPVAAGSLLPGSGVGLTGLRERVAVAEGTLTAGPYRGGWRVRAVLPLPTV